jgi:hypothetical protein
VLKPSHTPRVSLSSGKAEAETPDQNLKDLRSQGSYPRCVTQPPAATPSGLLWDSWKPRAWPVPCELQCAVYQWAGCSTPCPPTSAELLSWPPLWPPGGLADRATSRSLERPTCASHPGQGKQDTKCLGGCLASWSLLLHTELGCQPGRVAFSS